MTRAKAVTHDTYRKRLLNRFKEYRAVHHAGQDELFDSNPRRYYMFKTEQADGNLFDPGLGQFVADGDLKQFADMGSSQALALSVLGTMKNRGGLSLLSRVPDDNGLTLLPNFELAEEMIFGHQVQIPGDEAQTRLDVLLPGRPGRLIIESRLMEQDFPRCPEAVSGECNGIFEYRDGLPAVRRCPLVKKGSRYWDLMPEVFFWDKDLEYFPCPMRDTYGFGRKLLAASFGSGQEFTPDEQLFVMIYDLNNPLYLRGGAADLQFRMAHAEFRRPGTLKSTTWQWIAQVLKDKGGYEDLLAWLEARYGITPRVFESDEVRDQFAC